MAKSTFKGPVRSENGFDHVAIAASTGTETVTNIVNSSGELVADLSGAAMTTTEGSGVAGAAAVSSEITKRGKIITTHIFIDVEDLVNSTTAGDIIGDSAAANAHFGQIISSESGQIFAGSMTCLEVPTGGDPDIDLYAAVESTGTENAAVSGLTTQIALVAAGGSWTLNESTAMTDLPDATSDYLYLTVGSAGGAPGTYTAGQFLIEFLGYEA